MKPDIEELRRKYIETPPRRYDIRGHSPYERG